jgi:hypothetical protein
MAYEINQNAIKLTHMAYKAFQKESKKLNSKFWSKHFENFLNLYDLKSGDFWVEDSILYFIYDKYTHENGLDKTVHSAMKPKVFYTYADLFLESKITRYGKVYGVTKNIENQFQKDQLARMKKEYEKAAIEKK